MEVHMPWAYRRLCNEVDNIMLRLDIFEHVGSIAVNASSPRHLAAGWGSSFTLGNRYFAA